MRISDWSSDVCSSDLPATRGARKSALLRIEKGVDVAIGMIAPCPAIQVLHGTTNKHSVIIGRQGELFHLAIARYVRDPNKRLPVLVFGNTLRHLIGKVGNLDRKSTRLNSSH